MKLAFNNNGYGQYPLLINLFYCGIQKGTSTLQENMHYTKMIMSTYTKLFTDTK